MADDAPFEHPVVTDYDVTWVTDILGLPENAFCGPDGADPRREVLKDMTTIDVSACPGSGKTTLLVAKLAILANKWKYRTKGICVLSHTNAARDEIEKRLGHSAVGRHLLAYPHFIGTIHGFVNEYIALPWLRSQGYPIRLIDSEICENRRWRKLHQKWRFALKNKHVEPSNIRIRDVHFNLEKKNGKFPFGDETATCSNLKDVCREVAKEGFHCYDDMFIWSEDLIQKWPQVISIIRNRFPLLFIDETQDNSEEQSSILYSIFVNGDNPVIRQRYGDENQAIFDFTEAKEAFTDKFPSEAIKRIIPNSHRFCHVIAKLAGPLGLNADTCNLIGEGPKCRDIPPIQNATPHTIFLFDDETITGVLDAYGSLIHSVFSPDLLRKGVFTAVGQVHRSDDDTNRPRHIVHYWSDYDPELCSKEPKPDCFLKYVYAGIGIAQKTMEANPLVEKIAEGVLRLAGMATNFSIFQKRGYCHRRVLRCLEGHPDTIEKYGRFVYEWAVIGNLPTKDVWQDGFSKQLREIAEVIASEPLTHEDANYFLRWQWMETEPFPEQETIKCRDNIYRYTNDGKTVCIRVGSIHSVKGETHTATLVLETFWNDHNMESLLGWVCNKKRGYSGAGVRNIKRLRIHYVAMTRPSHLLCLAMKKSSFENAKGEPNKDILNRLSDRGWRIFLIQ